MVNLKLDVDIFFCLFKEGTHIFCLLKEGTHIFCVLKEGTHFSFLFKEGTRLEARDRIDNKWWTAKVSLF